MLFRSLEKIDHIHNLEVFLKAILAKGFLQFEMCFEHLMFPKPFPKSGFELPRSMVQGYAKMSILEDIADIEIHLRNILGKGSGIMTFAKTFYMFNSSLRRIPLAKAFQNMH